jgi:hypothetical protein
MFISMQHSQLKQNQERATMLHTIKCIGSYNTHVQHTRHVYIWHRCDTVLAA